MELLLGILIGLVVAGLIFTILIYLKKPIERQIDQIQSRVKEKGKIFEPESEELSSWLNNLKHEDSATE